MDGTLETDADVQIFIDLVARRLKPEIMAELGKMCSFTPYVSVQFFLKSAPDIFISETAKAAITELCVWTIPITAKDLEQFVEKSVRKLRPVVRAYRAAAAPKLRAD